MKLTPRIVAEILHHEGIVLEAYKDSVGVWTWGIGVTNASGHTVTRYIDKPQPLERVLEVYVWLLRTKYLPGVARAFSGHKMTEAQIAAALSFHWNTGAIGRASWVKKWKAGNVAGAKKSFMDWRKPAEIIPRRRMERDLFFDGKWQSDGRGTIYGVRKPSYQPDWGSAQKVDVMAPLELLLEAAERPRQPDVEPTPEKPSGGLVAVLVAFLKAIFGGRK